MPLVAEAESGVHIHLANADGQTQPVLQRAHAGHPVEIRSRHINGGDVAAERCEQVGKDEVDHRAVQH